MIDVIIRAALGQSQWLMAVIITNLLWYYI